MKRRITLTQEAARLVDELVNKTGMPHGFVVNAILVSGSTNMEGIENVIEEHSQSIRQ